MQPKPRAKLVFFFLRCSPNPTQESWGSASLWILRRLSLARRIPWLWPAIIRLQEVHAHILKRDERSAPSANAWVHIELSC